MTRADIIDQARRYSRTTSSGIPDSHVSDLINDALYAIGDDVFGFPAEEYITLAGAWDLQTNMAISVTVTGGSNDITATDVAIVGTDAFDQTGAQVATALQSNIIAAGASDVTVAYDSNNFAFTITDAGATAITVTSPSGNQYIDAVAMLFGGATSEQDGTWTGGFPEDCTIEASLPSDFMKMEYVEWDGRRLFSAPGWAAVSPQSPGTPLYYYIRGAKIRLWPVPTGQKLFHIRYKKYPAELSADTNIPSELPTPYHKGIAYWVAAEMCSENWDQEEHDRLFNKYLLYRNRYLTNYANQHTDAEETSIEDRVNYKVVT